LRFIEKESEAEISSVTVLEEILTLSLKLFQVMVRPLLDYAQPTPLIVCKEKSTARLATMHKE